MTEREAIKVALMMEWAEQGLTPGEVQDQIQKLGAVLEKRADLSGIASSLGQGIGSGMHLGLGAAVALPVSAGLLGAYALNRAREADVDDEDVRTRETIDELRQWARRAREQAKHKVPHLPM